jgi:phosphoribosylformylglycinamidine synthase
VNWLAEVRITLKPSVNDPEGQSIRGGLRSLGFVDVEAVRSGKYIQVKLAAADKAAAETAVDQMCAKLLANPVIEQYSFSVAEA